MTKCCKTYSPPSSTCPRSSILWIPDVSPIVDRKYKNNLDLIKGLIYNKMIRFHFKGYKMKFNTNCKCNRRQFRTSNIHKGFTFFFQGICQSLLVKQHKTHIFPKKKWIGMHVIIFNTQHNLVIEMIWSPHKW
jgi:hypothetical protein